MSAIMARSTGFSLDRTRTSAEIQERSPLPNQRQQPLRAKRMVSSSNAPNKTSRHCP